MEDLNLIIELFIRENGGRDTLANTIECEWCKSFYHTNNYYSHAETLYLLSNYNTKTSDYIARRLNRSYRSVRCKIQQLREKSMIDYRKINDAS